MRVQDCLRVYFILGSNNCSKDPLHVLEKALQGGITLFQFREKGIGAKEGIEKRELARKMKQLCEKYTVPFIVNDDVQLAIEIEADGVHVGQDDESVAMIKKLCPKDFIIGVSATNTKEAVQAVEDGADYIGLGPIYATSTKADAKTPVGLTGISQIRALVGETPIVAIGGIKKEHVADIIKAGADGVSVISAISQAGAPEMAAREIRKSVKSEIERLSFLNFNTRDN